MRRSLARRIFMIWNDPDTQRMHNFISHVYFTTLEHTLHTTLFAVWLAELLHIKYDPKDLITGCMLHDYYLYDYTKLKGFDRFWQGPRHGRIALKKCRESVYIK